MLYCKHCGYKLIKDSRFCMNCCSPIDEEYGILDTEEQDFNADNLHIEKTESSDDFNEFEVFGITSDQNLVPTFKEPKKRLRDLLKFKKK